MATRRKFSDEYKREAVRLATQAGVTKSPIGRELVRLAKLGRQPVG
jgi:transposase-like protein